MHHDHAAVVARGQFGHWVRADPTRTPGLTIRPCGLAANAMTTLINTKRSGKPVTAKARPRGENVVDPMDALRQSIDQASSSPAKPAKRPRKAAAGQKEMLMPIQGKKVAKETAAKKPASKQRKSA